MNVRKIVEENRLPIMVVGGAVLCAMGSIAVLKFGRRIFAEREIIKETAKSTCEFLDAAFDVGKDAEEYIRITTEAFKTINNGSTIIKNANGQAFDVVGALVFGKPIR